MQSAVDGHYTHSLAWHHWEAENLFFLSKYKSFNRRSVQLCSGHCFPTKSLNIHACRGFVCVSLKALELTLNSCQKILHVEESTNRFGRTEKNSKNENRILFKLNNDCLSLVWLYRRILLLLSSLSLCVDSVDELIRSVLALSCLRSFGVCVCVWGTNRYVN